jgi:hypothetical protein
MNGSRRLTQPLVRDRRGAPLRPASWDEALDRAASGVRALQLLEEHERDELRRAEVRARGPRLEQHRQLQPHLTCPERRRSGGGVRMGGGTSSYQEIEETDCILLWGSNARETHPIFFHHLLKGVPTRRAPVRHRPAAHPSAEWADVWAGSMSAPTSRSPTRWAARSSPPACSTLTSSPTRRGLREYRAAVEPWTLERGRASPACPAAAIREMAHTYATRRAR